jgi:hypothetical protein
VRYDCIRKEDISGIASCVFTKTGQGEEEFIVLISCYECTQGEEEEHEILIMI